MASVASMNAFVRAVAARPPRSLRERAERFLLDAGVIVKPAWSRIPFEVPKAGQWLQSQFRFPRAEGHVVVCGFVASNFAGAMHGSIRVSGGARRYLDEVGVNAVLVHELLGVGEIFDDATDWPRPIVLAPGEPLTLEGQFTVDDGSPGEVGNLDAIAFFTDARGADLLIQQGELWAKTLDVTSTSDDSGVAEDTFTAPEGAKIDLDALVNADSTDSPTVDSLEILVGNVVLTPAPRLTYAWFGEVASTDDRASIAGLELRPGEQLVVRQTVAGLASGASRKQRFTFIGRRVRDGRSV
jgi:hypothetical protein